MSRTRPILESFLKACKGFPQDEHPEIYVSLMTIHGQTGHKGIVEEYDDDYILLKKETGERVLIPISRIGYITCDDGEFCDGVLYL